MKTIINLLRGIVSLTVRAPFPERLMNLCAQQRLDFWGVEWLDGHTFTVDIHRDDLKRFRELAERLGCQAEVGARRGLPFFLARFRKRYTFLIGLALSLAAVAVLSSVVFTVQVTGNQRVPSAQILGELRRLGLRPGAFGPALELRQISQEAITALDQISWMGINLYGTRAEVVVREAVEPPEVLDEGGCYDVVAAADGVVTRVEPMRGEALVEEGSVVLAGDVLITGRVSMEPPKYSDQPVRYYNTHARGRVLARTWRVLTAKIPLTASVKDYTGEEESRYSVTFFGYPIEFFRNSSISWSCYDKITETVPLRLGDTVLPAAWVRERYRAYEPRQTQVDPEAAQALLEGELQKRLEGLIGEDGGVESAQFSAQVKDGWLAVTLSAQCTEQIGREMQAYYPETDPAS